MARVRIPPGVKSRRIRRFRKRKSFALRLHHFKRSVIYDDWVIPVTNVGGGAFSFNIGQLPNYTEFTALFDSYRINKVVLRFSATNAFSNMVNYTSAPQIAAPKVYFYRDYDDAAAPASLNDILQHEQIKVWNTARNTDFSISLVPAVASEVYRSATATAYAPKHRLWLDCTYPDAPHYGLKYFIEDNGASQNTMKVKVMATFYMSYKDTR